jgi:hypothetical protein
MNTTEKVETVKGLIFKLVMSASKSKPITSTDIAAYVKLKLDLERFSQYQVRAVINTLRQDEIPVLANGRGYWVSYDKHEIAEFLTSMKGRIDAQMDAYSGLVSCFKSIV